MAKELLGERKNLVGEYLGGHTDRAGLHHQREVENPCAGKEGNVYLQVTGK